MQFNFDWQLTQRSVQTTQSKRSKWETKNCQFVTTSYEYLICNIFETDTMSPVSRSPLAIVFVWIGARVCVCVFPSLPIKIKHIWNIGNAASSVYGLNRSNSFQFFDYAYYFKLRISQTKTIDERNMTSIQFHLESTCPVLKSVLFVAHWRKSKSIPGIRFKILRLI